MKVRELLSQLNNFDPDMDVHFAHQSPGKDHWLSPQIQGICVSGVTWSFLHDTPQLAETLAEQSMSKDAVILLP